MKPCGDGDVTKSHMAWHTPRRNGRDGPSPITAGDQRQYLLVSNNAGIASCYDTATGKDLWKQRIGTGAITASPFAAGGRVYFQFESGEVVVVEAGPEPKVLARNTVEPGSGELFRASPTPCRGQVLLRSDRVLYCVGGGK